MCVCDQFKVEPLPDRAAYNTTNACQILLPVALHQYDVRVWKKKGDLSPMVVVHSSASCLKPLWFISHAQKL